MENKFKVGDKVWFYAKDYYNKGEIIDTIGNSFRVEYLDRTYFIHRSELFPTKQSAIEYFKEQGE